MTRSSELELGASRKVLCRICPRFHRLFFLCLRSSDSCYVEMLIFGHVYIVSSIAFELKFRCGVFHYIRNVTKRYTGVGCTSAAKTFLNVRGLVFRTLIFLWTHFLFCRFVTHSSCLPLVGQQRAKILCRRALASGLRSLTDPR